MMAKKSKKILDFFITQDFLGRVGGEYAFELAKICNNKRGAVTDEQIGRKLKPLKITEIRAILNRLHYRGIACYQKTRNNKTGWYSYTWEIKPRRIAELILEEQAEEIAKLEKKIEFEKNHMFFRCNKKCDSLPFEIAAEYNFICPTCGGAMDVADNKKLVRDLRAKIRLIKNEVKELEKIVEKSQIVGQLKHPC
jgi:transcription initiation factor TFIIE subunit alpha